MTDYVLRLLVLLPLVCGAIYGTLYLMKKMQARQPNASGGGLAIMAVLPLAHGLRLAVVQFESQKILVGIGKNGVTLLAAQTSRPET
jgi:flagellar protein FliO/FliZ